MIQIFDYIHSVCYLSFIIKNFINYNFYHYEFKSHKNDWILYKCLKQHFIFFYTSFFIQVSWLIHHRNLTIIELYYAYLANLIYWIWIHFYYIFIEISLEKHMSLSRDCPFYTTGFCLSRSTGIPELPIDGFRSSRCLLERILDASTSMAI